MAASHGAPSYGGGGGHVSAPSGGGGGHYPEVAADTPAVAVGADTPLGVAIPAVAVTKGVASSVSDEQVAVNEVRQRREGRAYGHALSISLVSLRVRLSWPGAAVPTGDHGRSYAGLSGAGRS